MAHLSQGRRLSFRAKKKWGLSSDRRLENCDSGNDPTFLLKIFCGGLNLFEYENAVFSYPAIRTVVVLLEGTCAVEDGV